MYCDIDKFNRYAILDLTEEQFDTVKLAVASFKVGVLSHPMQQHPQRDWDQYKCCVVLESLIQQLQNQKKQIRT